MDELDKYMKAGKIASKARKKSRKIIKKGKTYLEAAEEIEEYIRQEGGEPAFPVNLSRDNEAAHYTPGKDSDRAFGEKDVVKVDIGTQIDGYVGGDTAYTIDFSGENPELVEASEEALENALSMVKAGVETREIGKEIQETIEKKGFKPVRNLTGHGLERWKTHTPPSIPNVRLRERIKLEEGQVIAIEPFASTGKGRVKNGSYKEIYSYDKDVSTRNRVARKLLKEVKEKYHTLPFAERWVSRDFNELKLRFAVKELLRKKSLISYSVLKDIEGSLVSQAEKTVIVEDDGCTVITE